jgi:hypothetical protein
LFNKINKNIEPSSQPQPIEHPTSQPTNQSTIGQNHKQHKPQPTAPTNQAII